MSEFELCPLCGQERFCKPTRAELAARIEQLKTAGDAAFFAMCAYRDSPDEEVFQNAIDALGVALEQR